MNPAAKLLRALRKKRPGSSVADEAENDFREDRVLDARISPAGDAAEIFVTWKDWPDSMGSWQMLAITWMCLVLQAGCKGEVVL